jgi:hypothetical protein
VKAALVARAAALSIGLLLAPAAQSAPAVDVKIEVDFLLGYIEQSGCDFYRNGTWHAPAAARKHLSEKYLFLSDRATVRTTEEFIDKVASRSSLSGEPYQVRCRGGLPQPSGPWLKDELARFRVFNKEPASGR